MRKPSSLLLPVLVGLILAPTQGRAASSLAFQDAFHAYVKILRLEEEQGLLALQTDLEERERSTKYRKLSADLTAARIDFNAVINAEQKSLSPWERKILERVSSKKGAPPGTAEPATLEALQEAFPRARELSPLEWQAVEEWFGHATQGAFLRASFAMEAAKTGRASPTEERPRLLWVTITHSPLLGRKELGLRRKRLEGVIRKLSAGYEITEVAINPYPRMEDQANGLQRDLASRLESGPALVVSDGPASAVVLKTFDLHPSLLARKDILGWVNANGQLFGSAETEKGRRPASIAVPAAKSPALQQDSQARLEELRLRQERFERQQPLGAKFRILNLVSLDRHAPGTRRLRDSLVPEGKTLYLPRGDSLEAIEAALGELRR